jgi:hypothetical protein
MRDDHIRDDVIADEIKPRLLCSLDVATAAAMMRECDFEALG